MERESERLGKKGRKKGTKYHVVRILGMIAVKWMNEVERSEPQRKGILQCPVWITIRINQVLLV